MGKTKVHGSQVLGVQTLEQAGQLLSDTSVEVHGGRVRDNLDAELLGDSSSKLGVADNQSLLNTLSLLRFRSGDLIDKELRKDLGKLSVLELSQILNGVGGGRESVDSLELEAEKEKKCIAHGSRLSFARKYAESV